MNMGQKDKISVIVPVFNAGKYISQCIDSILNQTFCDYELILVDDGSTDDSFEIMESYAEKDRRIKILHQLNKGVVRARKNGFNLATGNLIAYADADDYLEPQMLEKLYHALTENGADVSMCGRFDDTADVSIEKHHGIHAGFYDKTALLRDVYPRMIVNGGFFDWGIFPGFWDKLFKRKMIESFQSTVDDNITMGEDAACTYPCLLNAQSIYIVGESLYHYRQTTSSMVKKRDSMEKDQERFRILYRTVNDSFTKDCGIYDLREQWLKYVLFLMIPRADQLYEGFYQLDYLFPLPQVRRGSDVVIYGMGTYGQRLFHVLESSGFCHVTACVDRNYKALQKLGLDVLPPDVLSDIKTDAVIIANTYYKSRTALYKELREKYPDMNIYMIDEELIFSHETIKAMGLL